MMPACCAGPSKVLTMTCRLSWKSSWEAVLLPALDSDPCSLSPFSSSPHLSPLSFLDLLVDSPLPLWLWRFASLQISLLMWILDAVVLQKVLFYLLAWWCDEFKTFPTSKIAPVMRDDYVIKECCYHFFMIYTQIGQHDTLVFWPSLASSGVNMGTHDKVHHKWSSCKK